MLKLVPILIPTFSLSAKSGLSAMAKDVMLMYRISPSESELYVANARLFTWDWEAKRHLNGWKTPLTSGIAVLTFLRTASTLCAMTCASGITEESWFPVVAT